MSLKPMSSPGPATLLVVDDNELNRDMLGRRLEKKGYRVRTVSSGKGALDLLAAEPIDLVLLDVEMPGLSGLDVLREVRKTRSSADLPIVMATARGDSQDVVQALEAGANDYVVKPLDFPVVLARVEAQLRLRVKSPAGAGTAAAESAEVGPGTLLAGKYRVEALIGSGAFGSVYHARHVDLAHDVAVKVLQTAARRTPDALARFRREGIAACRVKHPNAVAVTDFGVTEGGCAFLVMERLQGHNLHDEIRQQGRLAAARCTEILAPLCGALAEAHAAGIVHRDVKPANVFLHRTPQGEVVKVLDFGIAKMADEDARAGNLTVDGGIIGTPAYMAPERFRGATLDGAADVYSVGVMLYQMLTGRLPFSAPDSDLMAVAMMHLNREPAPLRDADPEIAPEVEQVVLSMLRKDPRDRPSMAQVATSFARAARGDGSGAPARPRAPAAGAPPPETMPTAVIPAPTPDSAPGPTLRQRRGPATQTAPAASRRRAAGPRRPRS